MQLHRVPATGCSLLPTLHWLPGCFPALLRCIPESWPCTGCWAASLFSRTAAQSHGPVNSLFWGRLCTCSKTKLPEAVVAMTRPSSDPATPGARVQPQAPPRVRLPFWGFLPLLGMGLPFPGSHMSYPSHTCCSATVGFASGHAGPPASSAPPREFTDVQPL